MQSAIAVLMKPLKKLKIGKSDGYDGLTSDYIINGTPLLTHYLLLLFSLMLSPGLGSSTVDQVLKYTKYPKYMPSTSKVKYSFFLKVLKYIKYFHIKYKYKYKYSY